MNKLRSLPFRVFLWDALIFFQHPPCCNGETEIMDKDKRFFKSLLIWYHYHMPISFISQITNERIVWSILTLPSTFLKRSSHCMWMAVFNGNVFSSTYLGLKMKLVSREKESFFRSELGTAVQTLLQGTRVEHDWTGTTGNTLPETSFHVTISRLLPPALRSLYM